MVKIKKYIAGKHNIANFKPGTLLEFKNGAIAVVLEDRKLGSKGVLRKRFQFQKSEKTKAKGKKSATKKSATKKSGKKSKK